MKKEIITHFLTIFFNYEGESTIFTKDDIPDIVENYLKIYPEITPNETNSTPKNNS